MATHELPIMGASCKPDSNCYFDVIKNQLTMNNQAGEQLALVVADGGSDEGLYGSFVVPQNYVGTPKFVIRGILDGVMTSKTLQFGVKGITVTDNEAYDAADSSEDTGSNTDDHADEDMFEVSITCSNFSGFAAGDVVYYYIYIDASGNDYAGNCLITEIAFQYADA